MMKSQLTNGTTTTARVSSIPTRDEQESNAAMTMAVEQTKAAVAQIEQVIKSYPVTSLAAATAVGVILGCWVKRK